MNYRHEIKMLLISIKEADRPYPLDIPTLSRLIHKSAIEYGVAFADSQSFFLPDITGFNFLTAQTKAVFELIVDEQVENEHSELIYLRHLLDVYSRLYKALQEYPPFVYERIYDEIQTTK